MKYQIKNILKSGYYYLVFFLLIAFVISCCMVLFIETMTDTMDIVLTDENVGTAAKLTFLNVVFLSLVITLIDAIRRKYTVERPVKRIIEGANQMMKGDFSVRIALQKSIVGGDSFNEIIKCFNKMAQELSGTETLRTDFISNVSHELKTPLAVMQNYGTLLGQEKLEDEKRVEYAKNITDASRRLADLITNILKLNKLENQQIFPVAKSYNLSEQLCECFISFENMWEKKELEIETDIEDDVMVVSDGEIMSLVWNNLLSNAIKFTDNGGKIGLKLYTDDEYAFVEISDTGCGISKEVGKHIFDKFYQGDTSHAMQGNGLGLALVKRVIDITGSDISVESELGKGTVFTVKMRRETNGEI